MLLIYIAGGGGGGGDGNLKCKQFVLREFWQGVTVFT